MKLSKELIQGVYIPIGAIIIGVIPWIVEYNFELRIYGLMISLYAILFLLYPFLWGDRFKFESKPRSVHTIDYPSYLEQNGFTNILSTSANQKELRRILLKGIKEVDPKELEKLRFPLFMEKFGILSIILFVLLDIKHLITQIATLVMIAILSSAHNNIVQLQTLHNTYFSEVALWHVTILFPLLTFMVISLYQIYNYHEIKNAHIRVGIELSDDIIQLTKAFKSLQNFD